MSSLATTGFDVPQNLSRGSSPFHQTPNWHEIQPTTKEMFNVSGASKLASVYSYEQIRPNQNFALQLRSLQQHYMILNDDRLIRQLLEEEPSLYALLIEAVNPLHLAFGENRIIHLRIQSSDDDIMVKVAVQLPADCRDHAEDSLRLFDNEWWLNNCHRSNGALVLDYEIA